MQKTICITGCSSGIGAAMAQEFHRRGCVVYATARRADSLDFLAVQGIRTLTLDVNDDVSIAAAFAAITSEQGQLDVLVNNAGFSQVGALIDLTREDFRNQFETNVIAPIMVARAAIGLMQTASRQSGKPAVLANVGSIVGIASTPFAGAYCASKAAIHSLSDTLRMELAPLGVRVVTIQPGAVQSRFGVNAEAKIRMPADSLYQSVSDKIHARARTIGEQSATPAGKFACPVVDALLADNPPSVIRGGKHSFALPLYKKLLPTATLDAKLSARFGLGDFSEN